MTAPDYAHGLRYTANLARLGELEQAIKAVADADRDRDAAVVYLYQLAPSDGDRRAFEQARDRLSSQRDHLADVLRLLHRLRSEVELSAVTSDLAPELEASVRAVADTERTGAAE